MLSAEPALATTVDGQSPDAIRGLKWRTEPRAPQPGDSFDTFGVRFDTQGIPYSAAIGSLVGNGFRTVILRVADMSDLPRGATVDQRNDEVIKLLRELSHRKMNVYLWKCQWFQRKDVDGGEYYRHAGADEFIADMSELINRARREGLMGLRGVSPIETNLNNCWELRDRALYVAKRINAHTDGWLKEHTFMMPGAGMGSYFKGLDNGGRTWLAAMERQVGHFALIYKHMKSQENGVCELEGLNTLWSYYVGSRASTTVDQQIRFLRNDMGFGDLERYFRYYRREFPRHTHVVFWGDVGDGVSLMSALEGEPQCNYNTVRALHRLIVKENQWHGYFFDFAFGDKAAAGADLWRYQMLVDRRSGRRTRNLAMNHSETHTVWSEWHKWAEENFAY
ncbi:hypothetical protein ACFV2N_45250 [Streptomyces sp. NPDC059680]|uniref:hypothetical protein n=1 Tax=Streptomyces sp. NPDC059680 TaxID=3346904 RepID=UPI0036B356B6